MNNFNLKEAERQLGLIDPNGVFRFVSMEERDGVDKGFPRERIGTLEECKIWIKQEIRADRSIFFTLNTLDGQGNKAKNIIGVRALLADVDDDAPAKTARLLICPFPPSLVVQTSPGRAQVFWLVDGVSCSEYSSVQKAIARYCSSDTKVHDLPRLVRLAGSIHRKSTPSAVIVLNASGRRYGREIIDFFTQADDETILNVDCEEAPQVEDDLMQALRDACGKVIDTPDGLRNDTLYKTAFSIGMSVAAGYLPAEVSRKMLEQAGELSGLDADEAKRTVQSAFSGAQEKFAAGSELLDDLTPPISGPNLKLVPLDGLMQMEILPVEYIVESWIPKRQVTLFSGHGGSGKSNCALAIAAHAACGQKIAGLPVTQCSVLYASLEDEANILQSRLKKIVEVHDLPIEDIQANLHLLDGTAKPQPLMAPLETYPRPLAVTSTFWELEQVALQSEASLIIIDNSSNAFFGNENSRPEVNQFMGRLIRLARKRNAAILLLAHVDKAAVRNRNQGDTYSGSTAWNNAARSRLALVAEGASILLYHEKANYSRAADPVEVTFIGGTPQFTPIRALEEVAEDDEATVLAAMKRAQQKDRFISGNVEPGKYCAMADLEEDALYPDELRWRVGRKRASEAIKRLLNEDRLVIELVRAGNGHKKKGLKLA